jgi:hypothetical protein
MPTALCRNPLARGLAVTAIALAATIAGCGKKKPPPAPPPPPPPPPAPAAVSFETLRQDMKGDARLSFSDSLGTVTDEDYARACVAFVDAFVKGDAAKLRGMMGPRGKDVLEGLEGAGEWTESTKNLEGVRVIAAGTVPSDLAIDGFPPMDDSLKEAKAVMDKWKKVFGSNMTPEDKIKAMTYLEVELRRLTKFLKETGRDNEFRQIDQYVIKLLNAPLLKPQNIFAPGYNQTLLFAVQVPGESYLAGWQAMKDGDKWVFEPASTTDAVKPRAADWDVVGMNGFALVQTVETLITGREGTLSVDDFIRDQERKEREATKPGAPGDRPTPAAPPAPAAPKGPGGA